MFDTYNTEYTQEECDQFNDEFDRRYNAGEWDGYTRDEAESAFNDEVSSRYIKTK